MTQGFLRDFLGGKRYPSDLILMIIWSSMTAVGVLTLPEGNIVRIILALPFVLLLPGYALVSALWPELNISSEEDEASPFMTAKRPDYLERLTLSMGLSLAIMSFMGIALHYVWKISLVSIVITDVGLIFIMSGSAWYRRMILPEEDRFFISLSVKSYQGMRNLGRIDRITAMVLGVSLIIASCTLGFLLLTPWEEEAFAELYILDQNYSIDNLPTNLSVNETGGLIVGVVCHEHELTSYRIVINLLNYTGERQNTTLLILNYTLDYGQNHNETVNFRINESGEYRLRIDLYIGNTGTLYDFCQIRIRVE